MIGKIKGKIELDIAGTKRLFQFGTGQMAYFLELEKTTLKEAVERLANPADNVRTMINFYYSAAHFSAMVRKESDPSVVIPTYYTVAEWLDDLMDQQKEELNEAAFKQFQENNPNLKAPETAAGL
jgi:hypothetical protein